MAGGTSIIKRSLESFLPQSVATTVLLDLHGYDGAPALATLQDSLCMSHSKTWWSSDKYADPHCIFLKPKIPSSNTWRKLLMESECYVEPSLLMRWLMDSNDALQTKCTMTVVARCWPCHSFLTFHRCCKHWKKGKQAAAPVSIKCVARCKETWWF